MNIRAATDLLRLDFVLFDAPTARAVNGARQGYRNYPDLPAFMGSLRRWAGETDRPEDPESETGNARNSDPRAQNIGSPRRPTPGQFICRKNGKCDSSKASRECPVATKSGGEPRALRTICATCFG